jgi:hypothetical protein
MPSSARLRQIWRRYLSDSQAFLRGVGIHPGSILADAADAEKAWADFCRQNPSKTGQNRLVLAISTIGLAKLSASPTVRLEIQRIEGESTAAQKRFFGALQGELPHAGIATPANLRTKARLVTTSRKTLVRLRMLSKGKVPSDPLLPASTLTRLERLLRQANGQSLEELAARWACKQVLKRDPGAQAALSNVEAARRLLDKRAPGWRKGLKPFDGL